MEQNIEISQAGPSQPCAVESRGSNAVDHSPRYNRNYNSRGRSFNGTPRPSRGEFGPPGTRPPRFLPKSGTYPHNNKPLYQSQMEFHRPQSHYRRDNRNSSRFRASNTNSSNSISNQVELYSDSEIKPENLRSVNDGENNLQPHNTNHRHENLSGPSTSMNGNPMNTKVQHSESDIIMESQQIESRITNLHGNAFQKPRFHQQQRPGRPQSDLLRPNRHRDPPTADQCRASDMSQSEIVEKQLRSNSFECMICCDFITQHHQIWHCYRCYNIFHLHCAKEWYKKSLDDKRVAMQAQAEASQTRNDFLKQRLKSVEWACPACREILHEAPTKYTCFCGKVERPEYRRYLVPHSCGQVCGRKRPEFDCPHTCNSLCHPGRCDICSLTSRKSCPCGKHAQEIRCSLQMESCGEPCEKLLNCGQHKCDKVCHVGACDDCAEKVEIKCHCGKMTKSFSCSDLPSDSGQRKKQLKSFSCTEICGKKLECGSHICMETCHSGTCSGCKLSNDRVRSCPCGSMRLDSEQLKKTRTSCLDPIPCCKGKCRKSLPCGPDNQHHQCQARCHNGPCPVCPLKTALRCECKSNTKNINCSEFFTITDSEDSKESSDKQQNRLFPSVNVLNSSPKFKCEIRCNKLLNCGRHKCQLTCCTAKNNSAPITTQQTGIQGNQQQHHICDKKCGKKLACGLHTCDEICHSGRCGDCPNIGWQELRCHCGSSVLYPPIACGTKPPACNKRCARRHACPHPVRHECHPDTEPCPPCAHFVTRKCFCGAESKDSVFCFASGYSCGKICNKSLPCKRHTCQRVCHEDTCTSKQTVQCKLPCPAKRFNCDHTCNLPCHSTSQCPFSECKRLVQVTCMCGNRTENVECRKITSDADNRARMAALSLNRNNQDGSIVINLKNRFQSSQNSSDKYKTLDCDESCAIAERNRKLADALEISSEHQAEQQQKLIQQQTSVSMPDDSLKNLKEIIFKDFKYACTIFKNLSNFVQIARESEKKFLFIKFRPVERIQREIIHELAVHFNCLVESHDEEPFKHVVVRAYRNKSCIPEFTMEQLATQQSQTLATIISDRK